MEVQVQYNVTLQLLLNILVGGYGLYFIVKLYYQDYKNNKDKKEHHIGN